MLSDREFCINSLEQDLIITRLMIEHAVIFEIVLRQEKNDFYQLFEIEKEKYEEFYRQLLLLADGKVREEFIQSQMIVTPFTKVLDAKTKSLYKTQYDESLSDKTLKLKPDNGFLITNELLNVITKTNQDLLLLLDDSKQSLVNLDNAVHNMEINYDQYIRHFLEEANLFIYIVNTINQKIKLTPTFAYNSSFDLNSSTQDHIIYLKSIIVQEGELLGLFEHYLLDYQKLMAEFDNDIYPLKMNNLLNESIILAEEFKKLISRIITTVLKNDNDSFIPILLDHFLKESFYFIMLLDYFKTNQ